MVNYLAVLVAAVVSFVLGFVYYLPKMPTGRKWMDLAGTKDVKPEGAAWRLPLGFLTSLLMASVVAVALDYAGAATIPAALGVGALLWLGFIGTITLGTFLWERKPFGLWVLNNVFNLIQVSVLSLILVVWV